MQRAVSSFLAAPALALMVLGLAACSSKNPLPAPFKGTTIDNPISCKDLQNGQIVDKQILLDGGVPNCGADGLRCPLSGVQGANTSSVCGSRSVVGLCESNQWTLACEAVPEASTRDASSEAEAGSADAGNTPDAGAD